MTDKPNVLWIIGDEFRTDALSCYGTPFPEVATPHMDRIAERGVRFSDCYCNSPICVPSRTSFMTATLPEATGVYGNEGAWLSFPYDRDLVTIPEHFARHGYRTLNFGKTHLPVALRPWQVDEHDGADLRSFYDGTDPALRGDEVYTPTLKAAIGGTFRGPAEFPGERVTRNATRWLREAARGDAPFLARVSYLQPHSPVVPPLSHAGRYDHLPWPDAIDPEAPGSDYERRFVEVLSTHALSPAAIRRVWADYHALVRWLDDQVGALLDALEAAGLAGNTIVMLNADHGVSLGERGRLQKHTFFPEVQRVPQIITFPPRLPPGQVRGDLCELLDLARTLCGLCGIPPAETFGGRDLFGPQPPPAEIFATIGFGAPDSRALPNQSVGAWDDGGGWPRRTCLRTARYRLDMTVRRNGRPVGPDEEDCYLADRARDPAESRNLAGVPEYRGVLDRLRARLRAHARTGIEPPLVPRYSDVEKGIN